MKTLKEIYDRVKDWKGVWRECVDTDEFVAAYEEEHPELKLERIKSIHERYVECLDIMLKNFNPRWNPEFRPKSDDFWLYFEIGGQKITTQNVHDYFINLINENYELQQEIARLKKELKK